MGHHSFISPTYLRTDTSGQDGDSDTLLENSDSAERMLTGGIETSKTGNEGRKREKEPVKHRLYIFLVWNISNNMPVTSWFLCSKDQYPLLSSVVRSTLSPSLKSWAPIASMPFQAGRIRTVRMMENQITQAGDWGFTVIHWPIFPNEL